MALFVYMDLTTKNYLSMQKNTYSISVWPHISWRNLISQSLPQYLTLSNQGDLKCKYAVDVQELFYSSKNLDWSYRDEVKWTLKVQI